MRKIRFAAAFAAIATLTLSATPSNARQCVEDYFTGEGGGNTWREGEANAHGDWSRNVRREIGKRWSRWSNADVRDESFDPVSKYFQWCTVQAYPCLSKKR